MQKIAASHLGNLHPDSRKQMKRTAKLARKSQAKKLVKTVSQDITPAPALSNKLKTDELKNTSENIPSVLNGENKMGKSAKKSLVRFSDEVLTQAISPYPALANKKKNNKLKNTPEIIKCLLTGKNNMVKSVTPKLKTKKQKNASETTPSLLNGENKVIEKVSRKKRKILSGNIPSSLNGENKMIQSDKISSQMNLNKKTKKQKNTSETIPNLVNAVHKMIESVKSSTQINSNNDHAGKSVLSKKSKRKLQLKNRKNADLPDSSVSDHNSNSIKSASDNKENLTESNGPSDLMNIECVSLDQSAKEKPIEAERKKSKKRKAKDVPLLQKVDNSVGGSRKVDDEPDSKSVAHKELKLNNIPTCINVTEKKLMKKLVMDLKLDSEELLQKMCDADVDKEYLCRNILTLTTMEPLGLNSKWIGFAHLMIEHLQATENEEERTCLAENIVVLITRGACILVGDAFASEKPIDNDLLSGVYVLFRSLLAYHKVDGDLQLGKVVGILAALYVDLTFRSGLVQDYKGKDKPKLLPHIFKKIVDKIGTPSLAETCLEMLLQINYLQPKESQVRRQLAAMFISHILKLCFPCGESFTPESCHQYILILYLLKHYHSVVPQEKADQMTKDLLAALGEIEVPEGLSLWRVEHILTTGRDFVLGHGVGEQHWGTLCTIDMAKFRKVLTYTSHQETLVNTLKEKAGLKVKISAKEAKANLCFVHPMLQLRKHLAGERKENLDRSEK